MSPIAPPDDDLDALTRDLTDFGGELVDPTPTIPSTSTYGYMGLPADRRVRQSAAPVAARPQPPPSFEDLTKDLAKYGGEVVEPPAPTVPIPTSYDDLTKDLAQYGGEVVRQPPAIVPDERQFTSGTKVTGVPARSPRSRACCRPRRTCSRRRHPMRAARR